MLIGPTGVGKTTTIAKLAARFAYKMPINYKVGIITLDSFRIGAIEQLKAYANIMRVPLVIVKKKLLYKTIAKFAPSSTSYYQQQLLINYSHWNEEKYFANEVTQLQSPLVFKVDGFKFALMSGFELHFDEIFAELSSKNIDCILVPSVSTFESFKRWKALLLSRAFTHNCYILRANRIGEYQDKEFTWKFYGDSMLASPDGEMLNHLGNREELMIVDMNHRDVLYSKRIWGFKEMIKKRSL